MYVLRFFLLNSMGQTPRIAFGRLNALSFFIKLEHHQLNWKIIFGWTWFTLKGQWHGVIGDSDDKVAPRHLFLTSWKANPLPQRNYTPS